MHYTREQKICAITIPPPNPNIPEQMYVSNKVIPKIQLVINNERSSSIKDPNVDMYCAWFNEIKKVKLEYNEEKKKFGSEIVYTIDIGNSFLVGFNFTMLKNKKYFTCEFDHEPVRKTN